MTRINRIPFANRATPSQPVFAVLAVATTLITSGCAPGYQATALRHAEKVYSDVSADPALKDNEKAAAHLAAARASLAKAQHNYDLLNLFGEPVDPRQVDSDAYVAEQNALAAKLVVAGQAADAELAKLTSEREQMLLAKQDREASEKARQQAELAAQAERDRRAAELTAALDRAKLSGAEIEQTPDQIKITFRKVTFDPNKSEIKSEFQSSLDQLAAALAQSYPTAKLSVHGYTDNTGSDAYNLMLSEQRAVAVKTFLIEKGVEPSRVASRGHGESDPIAPNTTAQGRAQNRRVELLVSNYDAQ